MYINNASTLTQPLHAADKQRWVDMENGYVTEKVALTNKNIEN